MTSSAINVAQTRLRPADRLSVPQSGKTVLGNVRLLAGPLYRAFTELREYLGNERSNIADLSAVYRSTYNLGITRPTSHQIEDDYPSLISACIIWNWLMARLTESLPETATLRDADDWFRGNSDENQLIKQIPSAIRETVVDELRNLKLDIQLLDLLPYIAEVFETHHEIISAIGSKRKSKRSTGVFYTPSDVADYIVHTLRSTSKMVEDEHRPSVWLDPACGTGVFLLSALHHDVKENISSRKYDVFEYATRELYGIDISRGALQSAAYSIVATCYYRHPLQPGALYKALTRMGRNLAQLDSTQLLEDIELRQVFPNLINTPIHVVSNPPYARKKTTNSESSSVTALPENKAVTNDNLYADFVRLMPKLLQTKDSSGGMVIPLSISYSTRRDSRELREHIASSCAEWRFAHFDRTPDSLFGDDVKTRNTIVFTAQSPKKETSIWSSKFLRWNSRKRTELFGSIEYVPSEADCREMIPKIGDRTGLHLYQLLQGLGDTLADAIAPIRKNDERPARYIRVQNTAYNWIPTELVGYTRAESPTEQRTASKDWTVTSQTDVAAIFAVLNSRLVYWLWRVRGDGFHLTDKFLLNTPVSVRALDARIESRLAELGVALWRKMQKSPIVSTNSGQTTKSYCPLYFDDQISEVDELLSRHLELPSGTTTYLKEQVQDTIIAGRDDEVAADGRYATVNVLGAVR